MKRVVIFFCIIISCSLLGQENNQFKDIDSTKVPAWAKKLPIDRDTLFAVGIGNSSDMSMSMSKARAYANNNLINDFTDTVIYIISNNGNAYIKTNSGKIDSVATKFIKDIKNPNTFRYVKTNVSAIIQDVEIVNLLHFKQEKQHYSIILIKCPKNNLKKLIYYN